MSTPRLLVTRDAAAYCGMQTTGALRKARLEGRVHAEGRRGGTGALVWNTRELDRFLGRDSASQAIRTPASLRGRRALDAICDAVAKYLTGDPTGGEGEP